jgi:prepilin-type N-terminal cleavage/methylation domain-containing protein
VSARGGFTLVETLVVIVVVSLLTLIAIPKFQDGITRSHMLDARAKVISSFAVARATAAGSARRATLHLSGNKVMVTASPRLATGAGTRDTIVRPYNLTATYGVTATNTVDSVLIDPNGLPRNGSNITLGHGSLRDTIQINAYGRVLR